VVRLLQSADWFAAPHSARAGEKGQRMKREYDLDSAITFLLIGLGVGSVLGIVFNPKQNRHRGTGHPASPATPPDMRVRIRRFGGFS
jgi:hypothetical protein